MVLERLNPVSGAGGRGAAGSRQLYREGQRFIVTVPGQSRLFLYADSRDEVIQGIREHRQGVVA